MSAWITVDSALWSIIKSRLWFISVSSICDFMNVRSVTSWLLSLSAISFFFKLVLKSSSRCFVSRSSSPKRCVSLRSCATRSVFCVVCCDFIARIVRITSIVHQRRCTLPAWRSEFIVFVMS